MKNIKQLPKWLALALCLSLVLGGLAACQKQGSPHASATHNPTLISVHPSQSGSTETAAVSAIDETAEFAESVKTTTTAEVSALPEPAIKSPDLVLLSPPVYSIILTLTNDRSFIKGMTPSSIRTANEKVIALLDPQYTRISTDFVDANFNVNIESLLALKPEQIIYYGDFQKKGLENVNVPMINTYRPELDPEIITTSWEELLSGQLNLPASHKLRDQWKQTKEILAARPKPQGLRGLVLFSNIQGQPLVSSGKSYGHEFLTMLGIENVAAGLTGKTGGAGQAAVSMETIAEWNPDVIFIGPGSPAAAVLANQVEGQDWGLLKAVQNGAVYDIPVGVYNWAMPCADSPLMPLWMLSKTAPAAYSEEQFRQALTDYYRDVYAVDLPDDIRQSILQPKTGK